MTGKWGATAVAATTVEEVIAAAVQLAVDTVVELNCASCTTPPATTLMSV